MIAKCESCGAKAHQQDSLHGKGNRVFNAMKKQEKAPQMYRCTVCGATTTKTA